MKKEIIITIACLLLFSCKPEKRFYEESGSVFHTLYHIKYEHDRLLTAEIDRELQDFNLSLNPFNPNSTISKVNRNEDVEVDSFFVAVFDRAKEIYRVSGGAFDPTVAPLINLWGFGYRNFDGVTPEAVDSLKAIAGFDRIRLENRRAVKDDSRIELNFSAIAKGYASDVIAALLEREGVENYMVEIGGEVAVKGKNPHRDCWQIGINRPEDDLTGFANEIESIAVLCDRSGLATSGNYRNFYVKDGKKYAHTIDPRTGYPSEQTILSATVTAPDCMTADACATAFMVLGAEKAIEMAKNVPGIDYYLICSDKSNGKYMTVRSLGINIK
ncbi:MAG: FAD:protein FMN transferase [Tannerella sp.]|jgi:thiamine biosynthesis lipoprotein|nr:FAD:protein FMN transferase [Tannerella sp.]